MVLYSTPGNRRATPVPPLKGPGVGLGKREFSQRRKHQPVPRGTVGAEPLPQSPTSKDVHSPWKSSKPQDCPAKPRPHLHPGCRAGPTVPSEPRGPLHEGELMSCPSWGAPFLPDSPMFTRQKQTEVYRSTCLGNARIPASLPPLSGQETATFFPPQEHATNTKFSKLPP